MKITSTQKSEGVTGKEREQGNMKPLDFIWINVDGVKWIHTHSVYPSTHLLWQPLVEVTDTAELFSVIRNRLPDRHIGANPPQPHTSYLSDPTFHTDRLDPCTRADLCLEIGAGEGREDKDERRRSERGEVRGNRAERRRKESIISGKDGRGGRG